MYPPIPRQRGLDLERRVLLLDSGQVVGAERRKLENLLQSVRYPLLEVLRHRPESLLQIAGCADAVERRGIEAENFSFRLLRELRIPVFLSQLLGDLEPP